MEKPIIDHIKRNLPQLIDCTTDEDIWYIYLLKHKFLSQSAWQIIRGTEHDTKSRIRQLYLHCTKTPQYDLLIQSLKDCDNDNAAKILEKYYETASSAYRSVSTTDLIWFDIKYGTKHYKGREEELDTIHNYWLEACRENSLTFVAITGLGGIGKSELATNYAQKFHNEVQGHCIWINAETIQSFSDSFHRLAKLLRVPLLDEFGKEINLETLTCDVYERLSKEKYLVVFDNLEDYEDHFLECFVQYTSKLPPSKIKPFVLLTSRYQLVNKDLGGLAIRINLTVLSESSAISFFKDALNITSENDYLVSNLKTMCGQLGYFPLAMQQAAAYINARSQYSDVAISVKDYSESFERESKSFLLHQLPKQKTTYLAWQITLDKLGRMPEVGSKAKLVLDVMSFFNAENMPVRFLEQVINLCDGTGITKNISTTPLPNLGYTYGFQTEVGSMNKTVDICQILADYSMCKISQIEDDICISVHRLVQVVSQINLQEEERWITFLNQLLQSVHDLVEAHNISFAHMTQIRSLLNHTKQNTKIISDHQKYSNLLVCIQNLYSKQGKYRDGAMYTSFAVKRMKELFGKDHRNTLRMMASHGNFSLQSGDLKRARDLLDQVFQSQQKLFLKCNQIEKIRIELDLLHTKHAIASLCREEGNYENALKMFVEVLEVQQQVIGIEHPDTLTTKYEIAHIYNQKGNYEYALKLFLEVLEVQQRVIGMEHPSTLTTKHNIAIIYEYQGDYDKALKMFLEVIELQQRVIGMEHPDSLDTKRNIVNIYFSQGDYNKALRMILEVLEVQQRVIGMEHPSTLTTKHNIANIYKSQGNYDEAWQMFVEVLEVQQRVIGMEHPNTLTTKYNIANIFFSQFNYDEALQIFLEVQEVQQRVIGMEHPSTLTTKHNIAKVYGSQGNYDKALKMFVEVLEVQQRVLGKEHPSTLNTKNNIASIFNSQGNYEKALEMFLDVLEVQQRVIGMEHPSTLTTKDYVDNITKIKLHLSTKHNNVDIYENESPVNYQNSEKMSLEGLEVEQQLVRMDSECDEPDALLTMHFTESKIGFGGFGDVYKVSYDDGTTRARKDISYQRYMDQLDSKVLREVRNWQKLNNHENIVTIYRFMVNEETKILKIYMEYCPDGDLDKWLNDIEVRDVSSGKNIFRDVLFGLIHIHHHKLIHRDLKPQNILLRRNVDRYIGKIGDFGLSTVSNQSVTKTKNTGSVYYMSPEQQTTQHYSFPTDIYSAGIVLFEILYCQSGNRSNSGEVDRLYFRKIITVSEFQKFPENFDATEDEKQLILKMVNDDVNTRPDAKTVMEIINESWLS